MIHYTPRPGSLAARLIEHLREHGGSVKASQIAAMFDAKNVANNLQFAIEHGALKRTGNAASTAYCLPDDPADAAAAPEVAPLEVVIYGDGDVAVKGHAISEADDATAVFTHAQIAYLVGKVARPLVQVAT